MVIGDGMVMKFGNEQDRKKNKCLVFSGTAGKVDRYTVLQVPGYNLGNGRGAL